MTSPAFLQPIVHLVPEVEQLLKISSANREDPLFADTPEGAVIASAVIQYAALPGVSANIPLEKIAYVQHAVDVLGVTKQAETLCSVLVDNHKFKSLNALEKTASHQSSSLRAVESELEREIRRPGRDLVKVAEQCRQLCASYGDLVESAVVKAHAGHGTLDKVAAVRNLQGRFSLTQDEGFTKIAAVIEGIGDRELTSDEVFAVGLAVASADTEHLRLGRHDPFMEFIKVASEGDTSCSKELEMGGTTIPVEDLVAAAKSLSAVIGEDIVKSLSEGSAFDRRSILASLPLDLKLILAEKVAQGE